MDSHTLERLGEQRFQAALKMVEGDKQAEVVYNQTGELILKMIVGRK